jgi:trehalose 6-phosphate phosphatase
MSRAMLVFDFDGTLAPIVRRPDGATMRSETRTLLRKVARSYPCAILSGRAVADLRLRFEGVPVRWLIGNHGAEGVTRALPNREQVLVWRKAMRAVAARNGGVTVEDKGLSLAIHYREAVDGTRARRAILNVASSLQGARLVPGKRVINLVPVEAPDKGAALAALVAHVRPDMVLFAGDDETDEDAFQRSLDVPYVTVRVGRKVETHAEFFVAGQKAVDRLLMALVDGRVPVKVGSMVARRVARTP